MGLTFDAEKHAYALDGKPIPSVTQVIRDAGLMGDTSWYTEGGRTRGSYVAQMIALYEEGTLDVAALDPELQAYLAQYIRFKGEAPFVVGLCERQVYDPIYRYAGTLDLMGSYARGQSVQTIIDVKLGQACDWHSVQLMAYRRCVRMSPAMSGATLECANLYLSPESYKLVPRKDTNDEKIFLAALAVVNWKRSHGL